MKFERGEANVAEADMTPMIDIVFQLIAFFMIVTNFEQTQADERVVLPADALARPPESARQDELVVNLGFLRDKQGNKTDEQAYIFVPGEDPVPLANYRAVLQQEVRMAKYSDIDPATMTISIRADSTAPAGLVQRLIKMARDEGFAIFALKATVDPDA